MRKILVVEDDTFLANAYKAKLTTAGFDIKVAPDGDAVMEVLHTFTPDLILLDLIMPKKNGFEVLKELKKNHQFKNIPVIIASNSGQKEDLDLGVQLGASDYFIKADTSLNDIIEKINTLLPN